jgi:tetratricopeptide (TPR) repeat protein
VLQQLFASAVRAHQAQRLDEAAQLYRRILSSNPRHVDSLHLLGVLAAQSGRPEQAARLIGEALALSPDFALAHYHNANALRAMGRKPEALAAYRRAIELAPDHAPSHNNLGALLRDLGLVEEAVAAYRRAIELRPTYPQAHYNLGTALRALGRHEEAIAALSRAIEHKADDVDAHLNLGAALLDLGRHDEALDAFGRALQLRPDCVEANGGLVAALQALGRPAEALEALEAMERLAPADPALLARLGGAYRNAGRTVAAVAAYRRIVALEPDDARAQLDLAAALNELGETAEAADCAARALSMDPASAAAWFLRSELKRFAADDPDIAAMETLLASASGQATDSEDRLNLEFALAKAWMDVGEPDRAFAHLDRANRQRRAGFTYDVEADVDRFAAIARSFSHARAAEAPGLGDPSDLPVFVVGMPRSGTSLIEQILASHPEVHGAGELKALGQVVAGAAELANRPGRDLAALGRAYVERAAPLAAGKRRLVDKMPGNFQYAGLIRLILPNARIIHCRRNPLDTCLSCYSKKFNERQDFAYDLRELGLYYRAYDQLMTHWRALLPAERFIEVRYEDVVDHLEAEARRLIAFCGLEWDAACLDFHQTRRPVLTASAAQVRQPLYRTSLARWELYRSHLAPLLQALGLAAGA